ncbi:hypothetical protein C1I98_33490 [Spongiactinospora gelatinilytica]|uniref:Uncharacterized protein n=1 Tax=Spongiactinospora gelatinilytica TaxID=2666298 RepID=A0A2W2ESM0_9ACTN|nr:hypothetical protein [Spongiactinospora gelatinilytica]PZG27292.1 hypothetical protein C1I98_33490 [Spongiactinospora gelatinilytica]
MITIGEWAGSLLNALARDRPLAAMAAFALLALMGGAGWAAWRLARGFTWADRWTFLGAVLAQGTAAQGMLAFFLDKLAMPPAAALLLFGFVEVAMLASTVRARDNIRRTAQAYAAGVRFQPPSAGADGVAVWVFAAISGVFAATDATTLAGAAFRLVPPLAAAWLWERGLVATSAHITGTRRSPLHWRLTPERLAVRFGLADPSERSASEASAHHLVARTAVAVHRAWRLNARPGRRWALTAWRRERALLAVDRAFRVLVERSDFATNPERQGELSAQLDVLLGARRALDHTPRPPWLSAQQPSGEHTEQPPAERPQARNEWPKERSPGDRERRPERSPSGGGRRSQGRERARRYWDEQIEAGRVPDAPELTRATGVGGSTARRYFTQWKQEPVAARLITVNGSTRKEP